MAKHDIGLNYETLLSCCAALLNSGGRLSFIIPAVDQKQFSGLADFYRLYPSRITRVRPAPGKEYSRCLIEFTGITGIPCSEDELTIRNRGLNTYSAEYIELTNDFYLGF